MPLPDRPVDGAEVETEWGQEVHDRVFAPKGCDVRSVTTTVVGTSTLQLHLDTATDDPGGWLGTDLVEVPTGGEGLYIGIVTVDAVNGSSSDSVRAFLNVNGVSVASSLEDSNGGTHVVVTVPFFLVLSAGDQLKVYAQKKGSGTSPTCKVTSLKLVRHGDSFGA